MRPGTEQVSVPVAGLGTTRRPAALRRQRPTRPELEAAAAPARRRALRLAAAEPASAENPTPRAYKGPAIPTDNAERCDFIDSTGLAALVASSTQVGERGGRFAVCCAGPAVQRLLDLTRTAEMFTLADADVKARLGELRGDPVRVQSVTLNRPKLVIENQGGTFNFKKAMEPSRFRPVPCQVRASP